MNTLEATARPLTTPIVCHTAAGPAEQSADELLSFAARIGTSLQAPFAPPLVATVKHLSRALMNSGYATSAPQLHALGFWLRGGAIKALETRAAVDASNVRVARGLAVHLPPANVDVLFCYSWVLSMLLGNSNITRLPSALSAVSELLLEHMLAALEHTGESERNRFFQAPLDTTIVRELSALCDARLIWGGDAKIGEVSRHPTHPDGLTLSFPDRKSVALLSARGYTAMSDADKTTLASRFYNDLYWFDQLGCGSPRLLCWVGGPEPPVQEFFERVLDVAKRRQLTTETGIDIEKFVTANTLLAEGWSTQAHRFNEHLTVVNGTAEAATLDIVQGGGFIVNARLVRLQDATSLVRRDLQTLAVAGFSMAEKRALARALAGRGGYRIVPIGDALNFDVIWDGIDLLGHLSRQIVVR